MIENIKEKKEEIKKIWLEHKADMLLGNIFKEFLGSYFDVSFVKSNPDWLFLLQWYKEWKKEERLEGVEDELKTMTDEKADEIQNKNRQRMILMLRTTLDTYEKSPKKVMTTGVSEIRQLYRAIQSLEEVKKRTDIARGKLKLDTVRTLLPYNRATTEELLTIKEKVNESFNRILKLKDGKPVRESAPYNG